MPRDRGENQTPLVAAFWVIVCFVLFFDQLTKYFAILHLSSADTYPVIPEIFHLTLVHNTGIAFGLLSNSRWILLAAISISLIVLCFWGMRGIRNGSHRVETIAIALILGGAIGNWIDRIRIGAVIDFLDFRIWPVFNAADSAITIGVCLYLIMIIRKPS